MSNESVSIVVGVIDDTPEMVLLIKSILHDYEILSFTNPRDSYSSLQRIDLLLLDYDLPEVNGLEYLHFLNEHYPHIPVIMITGHGSETVCQSAFRLGVKDYIKKPFVASELRETISGVLGEQQGEAGFGKGEASIQDPAILNKMYTAKHYIDQNISEIVRLDDVLKYVGMSKTPFEKHFKAFFGMTFSGYMLSRRIEKAKTMLAKGYSVSQVAEECGFQDISHFSKTFKKHTGELPSKYEAHK